MPLPPLAASDLSATAVVLLIGAGALVTLAGHVARSRRTTVAGLALLFVATTLLLVGAYVAYRGGVRDPRPCDPPGC